MRPLLNCSCSAALKHAALGSSCGATGTMTCSGRIFHILMVRGKKENLYASTRMLQAGYCWLWLLIVVFGLEVGLEFNVELKGAMYGGMGTAARLLTAL